MHFAARGASLARPQIPQTMLRKSNVDQSSSFNDRFLQVCFDQFARHRIAIAIVAAVFCAAGWVGCTKHEETVAEKKLPIVRVEKPAIERNHRLRLLHRPHRGH